MTAHKRLSKEKKVVIENFTSLFSIQALNYILPIVTFPYLVRVLGVEKFGLISFAQAFMQYFLLLTDYGGLAFVREVAVYREDNRNISLIFSSVTAIKTIFILLGGVLLCGIVYYVPKFRLDWQVYIFSFGMVIGRVFFPSWFYQGMEKMKYITLLNIVSRVIFTIAIFAFVKTKTDYLLVPLINSIGYLSAGIISLVILMWEFRIKIAMPTYASIQYHLRQGWHFFISMTAINFYTTTNTVILGLFTSNRIVGYYSAGEKVIGILSQLYTPLFQALYPYISKIASQSKEHAIRILRKICGLSFFISIVICIGIFVFAKDVTHILLGEAFSESVIIMKIMAPLSCIIPMAYIFSNLGLLPFRLDKYFSRIYITGAVANLISLFLFLIVLKMGGVGAAISNMLTQTLATVLMVVTLEKNGINLIYVKLFNTGANNRKDMR